MTEQESNGKLSYPIKDLFAQILERLSNIDGKLEEKADSNEVQSMRAELKTTQDRVLILETQRSDKKDFISFWLPILVSIGNTLGLIFITWRVGGITPHS